MENTKTEITKDTIIGTILQTAPEAAPMFMSIGMHCLGCPASLGETVDEACMVHGVDTDEFLEALNEYLADQAAFAAEYADTLQ